MKVKDLTNKMNDHGTNPRVHILEFKGDHRLLVFEGRPANMSERIANLTLETFTVANTGFLKIYAKETIRRVD